jgi:hypothetical protein
MKTKNIKVLISGLILLAATIAASAQESMTMHFMKGMPQASMYNPALHNDSSSVVLGLPGLSGIYFGLNSDFAVNDLIHYGTGSMSDSLVVDINGFHNSLKNHNYFRQNFELALFFLGFRTKKLFVSFGINEKELTRIGFEKRFITFLKDGNASSMGKVQDVGNLTFDAYHYREFALGISRELMDRRLSVGVRLKALFGKFALQTNKLNFQVETAQDGSSIKLTTDMELDFSVPMEPEYDDDDYLNGFNDDNFTANDYIFNTDNMGMAFDLGAVFKVNPKITVSASILDIGKIPFKTDAYNVNHLQTYTWEGIDFSNSFDDTDPNYISADDMVDEEMDKLEAVVKPKRSEVSSNKFDMTIPTKIFVGGTYTVSDKLNFGLLNRIYMYNGETNNNTTLSANALLGKFFSVTGSYSAISGTYDNLGLGMGLRLGFFQLYMVNDNLLALTDPAKAQFVNVRFGMNFLFGRNYRKFVH